MEAVAGRSGALPAPTPSQPSRKEWRAVPEHSFQGNGSEGVDQTKLGQSDERTIYEAVGGQLDVDFCSITIDNGGGLNEGAAAQQRIHEISQRRMELEEMEIELRAQAFARSEILEMRDRYGEQLKESSDEVKDLKDQLQKRQHEMHDLEQKIDEKEKDLRELRIDNEAAWAKEDLLREQNKELLNFRRDRDNWEAERAQLVKQVHDLQDHIHEKENRSLELEEQHRIAQEAILYKDEQLREAQAWMAHAQMDALQSTANQSLQAELRDRTEQFNQYWGCLVRQYTDMERHLLQVIQQLQLELASMRDPNGIINEESKLMHSNSQDLSAHVYNMGNHFSELSKGTTNDNKSEQIVGAPIAPSSVLGMGSAIPPSQMNALHPLLMHQGALYSIASVDAHIPASQLGHFQQIPAILSNQNWLSPQAESTASHVPNQNQQFPSSQAEKTYLQSDSRYTHDQSCDIPVPDSDASDYPVTTSAIATSNAEMQNMTEKVIDCIGNQHMVSQGSSQISSENFQFDYSPKTNLPEPNNDGKVFDEISSSERNELQNPTLKSGQSQPTANSAGSDISVHSVIPSEALVSDDNASRASNSSTHAKASEPALLDEKSLLACIVRAVPASSFARIKISATLPNRLGKMLKPLHWHDYKKQYGKLDDFVSCHPELFVIEGDFIHLREGAQEIVSANTAAAKFAAATAASSPYLSRSVVVTPVAQGHRIKRCQSSDDESAKIIATTGSTLSFNSANSCNMYASSTVNSNEQPNGSSLNTVQGSSDVKILRKTESFEKANGLSSGTPTHYVSHLSSANGKNADEGLSISQNKGVVNARHGNGLRQQGRQLPGAGFAGRR